MIFKLILFFYYFIEIVSIVYLNYCQKNDVILLLLVTLFTFILNDKFNPKWYQKKIKYVSAPFIYSILIQLFFGLVFFKWGNSSEVIFPIIFGNFIFEMILLFVFYRKMTLNHKISLVNSYNQTILEIDDAESKQQSTKNQIANITSENIIDFSKEHLSNDLIRIENIALNNWYYINSKFQAHYHKLSPGGFLIVKFKSRNQVINRLKNQFFGKSLSFIKIFVHDVLAKIPYLSKLINWIIKGKNKLLSEIEVKGRVYYNGFKIEKQFLVENEIYLILRKVNSISDNPSPSFHLITNLNRVSMFGNIIKIRKIRSMYPYSEFLQKDVFESNQLDTSGKFNDDPRITGIGKFIRKYWIDEIPQFFELLSGKIKLVGIRAMSEHYFSLYSDDYKQLYYQVKPGIISPIFDDNCPFSEIERIEKEYLISYIESPLRTDVKYFFKTILKILKGTRSK